MVVVGGSGDHHIATHNCAGFLSASQSVIAPGLPYLICSSASRAWSRGPRFLVRSLHHLSASANSQDSPAIDRTGRALSFDQRECLGHVCSFTFVRPQDFQQSFVSENPWVFA